MAEWKLTKQKNYRGPEKDKPFNTGWSQSTTDTDGYNFFIACNVELRMWNMLVKTLNDMKAECQSNLEDFKDDDEMTHAPLRPINPRSRKKEVVDFTRTQSPSPPPRVQSVVHHPSAYIEFFASH